MVLQYLQRQLIGVRQQARNLLVGHHLKSLADCLAGPIVASQIACALLVVQYARAHRHPQLADDLLGELGGALRPSQAARPESAYCDRRVK